jgi:hypothetical protein
MSDDEKRPNYCDLAPPSDLVLSARAVMGAIDLDPYTTPQNNRLTLAARIFDRNKLSFDEILSREWTCRGDKRLFLGPPASATACRRLCNKALREYREGHIDEAIIWLGNNESLIRMPWIWDFPVCMPFRRLRPCYYDDELDQFRNINPSSWTAVVYMPPCINSDVFNRKLARFHVTFSPVGRVVFNQFSGEDDWKYAYQAATRKPYDFRN